MKRIWDARNTISVGRGVFKQSYYEMTIKTRTRKIKEAIMGAVHIHGLDYSGKSQKLYEKT